jgi:hypothetical protein
MLLMPLDDATKSALEEIASLLNAQINQYAVNYRRHAGVVVGKKKGDNIVNEQDGIEKSVK